MRPKVRSTLNKNKRLFIKYGVPNATEAFPFDVSIYTVYLFSTVLFLNELAIFSWTE